MHKSINLHYMFRNPVLLFSRFLLTDKFSRKLLKQVMGVRGHWIRIHTFNGLTSHDKCGVAGCKRRF